MSTMESKALPAKRPAPVDSEGDQSKVDQTDPPPKKRTPLPTLPPDFARKREEARRLLAAKERLAAKRKKQLATINNDDEENQVDPSQKPSLEGADGVVLKSGKYCCNLCGNRMQNEKRRIESHNSKLHPKDPVKGSAYLRRMAQVTRKLMPCSKCDKMCNSVETLEAHMRRAHPQAEQSSSPLANGYQLDGEE
ncbi:hypothetical protein F5Y09DRAFT_340655 [Xylaria sp. FL1042]|nr:hypothetical protein F5Y09DRAFT_340655 [Xylaria sp. FL1042]